MSVDWVKLHTGYPGDPKIRRLADEGAELMFIRGLAYSGAEESGGFIPRHDVGQLTRRRRYEALVSALLASKLWTEVDGGYQITNWDQWQDGLDELARRRASDRERQRRHRAALSRDVSRDSPVMSRPQRGEVDPYRVTQGDTGNGSASRDAPPPRRCPRHQNDPDPPNCGACKERRLAAEQRDRQQAEQQQAQQHQAAAVRRTTRLCRRCGTRHTGDCPDRGGRP